MSQPGTKQPETVGSRDTGVTATGPVWGLPGTILWGLVVAAVFVFGQVFGMGLFIGLSQSGVDEPGFEQSMGEYQLHGIGISFGVFCALIFCLPLLLSAIKLKRGSSIKRYLGLRWFDLRALGYWFLIIFACLLAYDGLAFLLGISIIPDFSIAIYESAEGSWILWLAIVLAAPLLEEMFFRGFLFSGLMASSLGPAGAIVTTSLLWAIIHVQYDYFWMLSILIIGLALGVVRYRTGSIVLTFVLHAAINLAAMVTTALAVS
jgi:membrane protease YdiL (CAAX protease family)